MKHEEKGGKDGKTAAYSHLLAAIELFVPCPVFFPAT